MNRFRVFKFLLSLSFAICCENRLSASDELAFLLPFQRAESCLLSTNGQTVIQSLEKMCDAHGLSSDPGKGIMVSVKSAFFSYAEKGNDDFFGKRDAAFKRAAFLAKKEIEKFLSPLPSIGPVGANPGINPGIVVLAQAEGWCESSNRYEVAVLSVGSHSIGKLFLDIRSGKSVVGPLGFNISERVKSYHGFLCGTRLLFDEKGTPWFLGGASRSVARKDSGDVSSRRNRGLADMFSRSYAISGLSDDALSMKLSGLRKIAGGTEFSERVCGWRYYSVYGVSAGDLALSYASQRQVQKIDVAGTSRSDVSDDRRVTTLKESNHAGKEGLGSPNDPDPAPTAPSQQDEAIKKVALQSDTNCIVEAAEVEKITKSGDLEVESGVSQNDATLFPVAKMLELCKKQAWSIGWDVSKSRVIQLGIANFQTSLEEEKELFFAKRNAALNRAFLNAVLKISCLLSFEKKKLPEGQVSFSVDGATLMKFSEGYDSVSRQYYVTALVTWSKTLERSARSLRAGEYFKMKPGHSSFPEWLERQNPIEIGLAQKYVDHNGLCWVFSAIPFFWSDSLPPNDRSRILDDVEKSLLEMLMLGCNVTLVLSGVEYQNLRTLMQSLPDHKEIDSCISNMTVRVGRSGTSIKGVREMIDVTTFHKPSGRRARVWVYATNVNLVKNSKE